MNGIKVLQCSKIEKMLIVALNETLNTLECTKIDITEQKISFGYAKKVSYRNIPIMIRNNNRLTKFRAFLLENDIEISDINLSDRVNKMIDFFC